MLSSLPPRHSDPVVKKDEPIQNMSNTISTFKRRREALDQSQQATNNFIANLVNATTQRETQDVVPVRPHELVHIMGGVLSWEPGDDCNLWGKDLTETVKAMKMYHLSEGVNFFRIFFAVHRLEAGFTIHCAHPGCKGNALIITPEFQNVNISTRSGYPRDQPEHAVFLASSCSHSEFSFEWRRSRVEEGDLTPLYLLQAAHSNPIFHQFTELKAGITTRDLDLEYDAMLELEKQRQALDAEQQKVAEASTKLRLQEAVFKRHAELLGSPMDWKAPTPLANRFFPTSPLTPRKRPRLDITMADALSPRSAGRFDSGGQPTPKRPRYGDSRPAHQYSNSTPQSFYQPADQPPGTGSEYPTTTPRSFDNAAQYAASEADRDVSGTERGDRGGGGHHRGGRNDRGGRNNRGGRNDRGGGGRGGQSHQQGRPNYSPRGQRHQQGGQSYEQTEQNHQQTDQHYQQGGQHSQGQQHEKDNPGQKNEKQKGKNKNEKKKGQKKENKTNDKKDKQKNDNKSQTKQAGQGGQDGGEAGGQGDFWENYARNSGGDSNGGPSGPSGPPTQHPAVDDEDGYIE